MSNKEKDKQEKNIKKYSKANIYTDRMSGKEIKSAIRYKNNV